MKTRTLDLRGLSCPLPVIRTKEALDGATSPIEVIVDNEGSMTNVTRFAQSQGAEVTLRRDGNDYRLTIRPVAGAVATEPPPIACSITKSLVVYVSSEHMGQGDDALGAVLMEAFLDTLSQFATRISHLVCVNAGARLAVEGSPVLEQLRQLEQMGVQVLVCGTCLNHFEIKDRLAVGSVSNMFSIIETLAGAGRIIQP